MQNTIVSLLIASGLLTHSLSAYENSQLSSLISSWQSPPQFDAMETLETHPLAFKKAPAKNPSSSKDYTYQIKCGKEKFQITFPVEPTLFNADAKQVAIISVDITHNVLYSLIAAPLDLKGKTLEETHEDLINQLKTSPQNFLTFEKGEKDGIPFLDIETYIEEENKRMKIRFLLSANIYILTTAYEEGNEEDHITFIDSFSVFNGN